MTNTLGMALAIMPAKATSPLISSTFLTEAEAEVAVAKAFADNAAKVTAWQVSGAKGMLTLNTSFSGGLVLRRGVVGTVPGTGVRIVLMGNGSGGSFIFTGYPIPQ